MILIQVILVIGFLLALFWFLSYPGSAQVKAWKRVAIVALFVFSIVSVPSPISPNWTAESVGVYSGANLLFYVLAVSFVAFVLNQYVHNGDAHERVILLNASAREPRSAEPEARSTNPKPAGAEIEHSTATKPNGRTLNTNQLAGTQSDAYAERLTRLGQALEAVARRAGAVPVEPPPPRPGLRARRRLRPRPQLAHLDGNGVGIDHNDVVRRGLTRARPHRIHAGRVRVVAGRAARAFRQPVLAHVLEHLSAAARPTSCRPTFRS